MFQSLREPAPHHPIGLPEMSENELSRHYSALGAGLSGQTTALSLGLLHHEVQPPHQRPKCPLPGFADIHPLQPVHTVQGALEALALAEQLLCEITGMDHMTFQPAAGAHGELTGILLIKRYHAERGDTERTEIIVPDSAHGTNPATVSMTGMTAVSIESGPDGRVDLDKLKAVVGPKTAGLMLTNPNTLGLFEKDILEITDIIHKAGGLVYYDGANLNAIMGIARPGDMGFDCVHLNLHKTFSTPHGGGGPGSGPVGCKDFLAPYLPRPVVEKEGEGYTLDYERPLSIGRIKTFYGNFAIVLRALTYVLTLGREGIKEASTQAVLNANYMRKKLSECYDIAYDYTCMHEFVMTLSGLKKEKGITAADIAKALIDRGIHPPTMYFPLIVPEALMIEPVETESKETMDEAIEALLDIYKVACADPESLHAAPLTTPVGRVDETAAARHPKLRYEG